MTTFDSFGKAMRRAQHLAHQYQLLLAIIVASIILSSALLWPRPPILEPRHDEVATVAACGPHAAG